MNKELPKAYDPKATEQKIYKLWEKSGFFNPDKLPARHKKPFTIVLPPPNVTGELHVGHTLQHIIHDIIIRQKRMAGYKTLWLPGTDHAGIATQNKVEQKLRKEGKTRFDLGREKFTEEVWKWREKYGNIILDQMKQLGDSCDWSRTRFTMDKDYVKAVEGAFIHYYQKGWVYKGLRVVNWCVRCGTSLSDLELEYQEEQGKLWYIKYPIKNSKEFITVATTRPETMLGDAAVAVNPKDERYKNLVGKTVALPIQNREIPIISDKAVDPKFGTGAVKITPLHDFNDWEISQRHNLDGPKIIDERGRMTEEAGKICEGLKINECREKVVEELEKRKLLKKVETSVHQVPHCYRCKTIIEPLANEQWFLRINELAKLAIKAVKSGEVKFHPKGWKKIYLDWLGNVRDWNISRQLWWGHRLPVWFCGGLRSNTVKKMGFAGDVVSQVFIDKTRTYRVRNHGLKKGDRVAFEDSASKEIFGYAAITNVQKKTVGDIDLKDPKHHKTYNTRKELIAAFKRHPQKIPIETISEKTPVWIYTYKFTPIEHIFTVSGKRPTKCPYCGGCGMERSPDVLDTWFSSALWPFATLGWPRKTKNLKTFYPTDVMITDRGIMNLWVARMIFSSYEFLNKKPFSDVIIHATVLTKEGKRMSKSLGTGVDPLNIIEKYGADATRFGMAYQAMGGQDIRFTEDHIVAGKKFCNKLWNISRFVLLQIGNSKFEIRNSKQILNSKSQTAADKKILAQLKRTMGAVNDHIENYRFGHAAHALYDFVWHDFADIYIEKSKKQIAYAKTGKEAENTKKILGYVLATTLKLLHPFIPFITEEIYQTLPLKRKRMLIIENWPNKRKVQSEKRKTTV